MEKTINTVEEYNAKTIESLQGFLKYKKETSLDYGTRLLTPFKVVTFTDKSGGNFVAYFENYDKSPVGSHYEIGRGEYNDYLRGFRRDGISLIIDRELVEDEKTIFEVNMMKNGIKKPRITDAEKFKGLKIKFNNKLYKSYDVQVETRSGSDIHKVIRVFVFEVSSAEEFIMNHTVLRNKIEMRGGIRIELQENEELGSSENRVNSEGQTEIKFWQFFSS